MSKSYTPGLRIVENTKVAKERVLPLKGELHVNVDDNVESNTIVASTKIPGNVHMVNVANELNIEAKQIFECMILKENDKIQKGAILAKSKGIFGLFKSRAKSPIKGTLGNISNVTGQVIVSEPPIPIEVNAYTYGTVLNVIPEEGLTVETHCAMVQGIIGIGGEKQGEIFIAASSIDETLSSDKIKDDYSNKILVGGSTITLNAFKKAVDIGVSAIVVGGINYTDLSNILGYTLGVAITGSEEIATTLVVTEGFGKISMSKRTYELLKSFEGNMASINGATQIRAGVIRPEIIITNQNNNTTKIDDSELAIQKDSLVRIIRDPFFRKVGKVKSLPPKLSQMESETMVRIAEIEFSEGEIHEIPRANLEMIVMDKIENE